MKRHFQAINFYKSENIQNECISFKTNKTTNDGIVIFSTSLPSPWSTASNNETKKDQYCNVDFEWVKTTPSGCNKLKTKNETNNARRMVDKLGMYNRKSFCIFSLTANKSLVEVQFQSTSLSSIFRL